MKNSLVPLVALALVSIVAWVLVSGGAARGEQGPAVNPGIFAFAKKDWQRTAPTDLPLTVSATGTSGGGEDWRVVQLSSDDTDPLTRTLLLGLGEELTRRRLVAVLDPAPLKHDRPEPLPLGIDAVLRIRASGSLPVRPGAVCAFAATIVVEPVRLPDDHPAARWAPIQATGGAGTGEFRIAIGTATVGDWPRWFAGVGRGVAKEICQRLAIPAELPDGAAAAHITANLWSEPAAGPGSGSTAFGRIPSPPQGDVVDHLAAFHHPLVRGWIGRINPVPLASRDGGTRDPVDALLDRLKKGEWQAQPTPAGFLALFSKASGHDALDQSKLISLRRLSDRIEVVQWQERPQAASVYQDWRARAAAGDAAAQALVDRHRATAGIPESLRSRP